MRLQRKEVHAPLMVCAAVRFIRNTTSTFDMTFDIESRRQVFNPGEFESGQETESSPFLTGVRFELSAVDLDPEDILGDSLVFDRLLSLETEVGSTTIDELRAVQVYGRAVMDYFAEQALPFSKKEQQIFAPGTLLSDIGKSGDIVVREADGEVRPAKEIEVQATRSIYESNAPLKRGEKYLRPNEVSVREGISMLYPDDEEKRAEIYVGLESIGMDIENETMRDFFNRHAQSTDDILREANVPAYIRCAASVHHLFEGVNPVDEEGNPLYDPKTGRFTRPDYTEKIGRADLLIILMDKYDAARHRGGGDRGHDRAIQFLETYILTEDNPHFMALSDELKTLSIDMLHDVDAALTEFQN